MYGWQRGSRGRQEHKVWHDVGLPIGRRPEGGGSSLAAVSASEAREDSYALIYNVSMKEVISVSVVVDVSMML